MANINNFLPFASTDNGTNLLSQTDYQNDTQRPTGNQPGVARLKLVNKVLRQTSFVAVAFTQFISDTLAVDMLDDGNSAALLAKVKQALNATPTASILPFGGTTAPAGWFLCNGQAVSRTTYATLFAAIGTTYGVGDGSTTFNVPNAQGLFLRGAGSQTIGGKTFSATLGTSTADTTAKNGLALNDPSHTHQERYNASVGVAPGGDGRVAGLAGDGSNSIASNYFTNGSTTGITLSGDAETKPANLAVNYIIKN